MTIQETFHISAIVPTLNEENALQTLISSLQNSRIGEIIVSDGGSKDRTLDIARKAGVRIVESAKGRGLQQDRGAEQANGSVLLFLHCDCILPADFPAIIQEVLSRPGTAAGAFRLKINSPGVSYRCIEWGANLRSRLLGLPYGDQAFFLRKSIYLRAGGFSGFPLLEDVDLVRRLRRMGRIRIAKASVTTSARRWQRLGPLKTTLLNQLILAGYLLGISPKNLGALYYRCYRDTPE